MTTTLTPAAPATRAAVDLDRRSRRVAAAAVAYPVVWAAGLLLASGPALDASPRVVAASYAQHGAATATQSVLVHGAAAIALAAVGLGIAGMRAARDLGATRVVRGAALLAMGISLVQMVFGLLAAVTGGDDADRASALFQALNRLDGVKMLALAAMVVAGAGLARRAVLPRWLAPLGAATAAALAVAAVGYLALLPGPAVAAFAALPLLLVWVCAAGLAAARR